MRQIILVTGPARSGKSEWAETLASQTNKNIIYVATAQINPDDKEWQLRIKKHQQRRPKTWQTLPVSKQLHQVINNYQNNCCLLIDSLGSWVANLLAENEENWYQISQELLVKLEQSGPDLIIVAEETGWGVIPAYPSGRLFRDRLGSLVRQTGAIASTVYLVTGGHVLNLSLLGQPLPPLILD
jgi:adenosylcobinamide kinase / adenosylcobinamide-phosphate guanylyltransferase